MKNELINLLNSREILENEVDNIEVKISLLNDDIDEIYVKIHNILMDNNFYDDYRFNCVCGEIYLNNLFYFRKDILPKIIYDDGDIRCIKFLCSDENDILVIEYRSTIFGEKNTILAEIPFYLFTENNTTELKNYIDTIKNNIAKQIDIANEAKKLEKIKRIEKELENLKK